MTEDGPGKQKTVVGVLAHVDAGKTTLAEAMLFLAGKTRQIGRVDKGSSVLDSQKVERERGITVFSKQTRFDWNGRSFILMDTPGHSDFSAEAERVLQILDYAILVISATDGIQSRTLALWEQLQAWEIPTFVFVNKTDLPFPPGIREALPRELDGRCLPLDTSAGPDKTDEALAQVSEEMLEEYLADGHVSRETAARALLERKFFPCFFGSALKLDGVSDLLDHLALWTEPAATDSGSFSGRVYKIQYALPGNGERLTWLRVTSGTLRVRDEVDYRGADGQNHREKVTQLRLYSADRYEQTDAVCAGDICAAVGLPGTYAGQGIGQEPDSGPLRSEAVLTCKITPAGKTDLKQLYLQLKRLEEEDPAMRYMWREEPPEISVSLMGEVQTQVLRQTIKDRFGLDVDIGKGEILYKEKVRKPVEGIGHFEPLRHYAEVHLLLEPLPSGCGLVFDTRCPVHVLDRNWQRQIIHALEEKNHRGILMGAPLTDTKITLLAGKASLKHTDGGDFKEACSRAVRQGLMSGGCELLEPYCRFSMQVPLTCLGRAVSDMQTAGATFETETAGKTAHLYGRAAYSLVADYPTQLAAYTKGEGLWVSSFDGYESCHDADRVLAEHPYDPLCDSDNTPQSIFCEKGAGFVVPWDEVRAHMHVDSGFVPGSQPAGEEILPSVRYLAGSYSLNDREVEEIMLREFGPVRRRQYREPKVLSGGKPAKEKTRLGELLVIDAYNLIYSWEALERTAADSLENARRALLDILSNYAGYTKTEMIVVFDAYNVSEQDAAAAPGIGREVKSDGPERMFSYDGYTVVFTAPKQTADAYIEKLVHRRGPDYRIRVVTSDRLVQQSAISSGVLRMSSREFQRELIRIRSEITELIYRIQEENS